MPLDRRLRDLGDVKPPPDYRDTKEVYTSDRFKRTKINRKMRSTGEPQGKSNRRYEDNDTWGEWAPGEFERSYPKNEKNAEWYRTHRYGKAYPDAPYDTWRPIAGPPTPPGRPKPNKGPADRKGGFRAGPPAPPAAAKAVAKAAKKGKK
jgi:hypothetical protein